MVWDDLFRATGEQRWRKGVSKMLKAGFKLVIAAPFYVDRWYEPLSDRYFADLCRLETLNGDWVGDDD